MRVDSHCSIPKFYQILFKIQILVYFNAILYCFTESLIAWRTQICVHSEFVRKPNFSVFKNHCESQSVIENTLKFEFQKNLDAIDLSSDSDLEQKIEKCEIQLENALKLAFMDMPSHGKSPSMTLHSEIWTLS